MKNPWSAGIPRIGASFRPWPSLSVRCRSGRSFKPGSPPSTADLQEMPQIDAVSKSIQVEMVRLRWRPRRVKCRPPGGIDAVRHASQTLVTTLVWAMARAGVFARSYKCLPQASAEPSQRCCPGAGDGLGLRLFKQGIGNQLRPTGPADARLPASSSAAARPPWLPALFGEANQSRSLVYRPGCPVESGRGISSMRKPNPTPAARLIRQKRSTRRRTATAGKFHRRLLAWQTSLKTIPS